MTEKKCELDEGMTTKRERRRSEWRATKKEPRRGQVDTPIVMVFAVVAGVLVLLVAGYFVLRQQEANDTARLLESLQRIGTTIDVAGSASETVQNVTLLEPLSVRCENDAPVLWYGEDESRTLPASVVFGAPSLEGVATLRSVPLGEAYRVTNVVLVTSPQSRFTAPQAFIDTAAAAFPLPLTGGSSWQHTIGGKMQSVSVTSNPSDSTAVLRSGTVQFGTPPNTEQRTYLGPALLAGALVSADVDAYDCGLAQVLERYRFVNSIQYERARRIAERYEQEQSSCKDLYQDLTAFERIENALRTQLGGATKKPEEFSETDATAIARAEQSIQELNTRLIRASCATVT
jgi:hypothetical protein